MISKRMKAIAAASLALGVALGGVRAASAQFGGLGSRPGADDAQVSYVNTNWLIAIETREKDGVKVYRVDDGSWSEYRAPKGTRVRPWGSGDTIATMPEGAKITQLAAYSGKAGAWRVQNLLEPAEGKVVPHIGPGMAVYVVGRRVYAFSDLASKWGVLELPEGAEPVPVLGSSVATVLHDGRIYIFNAKFGRWDDSGDHAK